MGWTDGEDNDLTFLLLPATVTLSPWAERNRSSFPEALIITNPALGKDFRYLIKQRGGMLAKGRLLGIQFQELMKDDLYFEAFRPRQCHGNEDPFTLVDLGIPMPIHYKPAVCGVYGF